MPFSEQLQIERARFAVATNGVIAAPLAGGLYWSALFVSSFFVSTFWWCLIAFIGSGLIFPLALALQKPTRCNMMVKGNPLGSAGGYGFANIAVAWAIVIPAFHTDPQLLPLALGIGMSFHLVSTAWSMNLKSYLVHPLLRAGAVAALWYILPEHRFSAISAAVALIYFGTIPFVLREVAAHRRFLNSAA